MEISVKKISDINRLFNQEKPRYVSLVDESMKPVVSWNNPKISAKKRLEEIQKKLQSENLPDGIYYFLYKDSLSANCPEYKIAIGKGNVSKQVTVRENNQITVPAESVWTVSDALGILSDRTRLELENTQLKKELKEANDYIEELVRKNPETDSSSKGMLSEIRELIEVFSPTIDKLVDQQDRKLRLAERNLSPAPGKNQPQSRADGGIHFESTDYPTYFHALMNQDNQELIEYELSLMEEYSPDMYKKFCDHYGIIAEEEDTSTGNTDE